MHPHNPVPAVAISQICSHNFPHNLGLFSFRIAIRKIAQFWRKSPNPAVSSVLTTRSRHFVCIWPVLFLAACTTCTTSIVLTLWIVRCVAYYIILADQGRLRPKIKYEVSSCQTVNWTWEVACWFSFSLFWKSQQLRIWQHERAYGFVFERHQRTIFSLRSCTACARVLSLCMLARARAGPPATAPALGHSEAAPQSGQMSYGR